MCAGDYRGRRSGARPGAKLADRPPFRKGPGAPA